MSNEMQQHQSAAANGECLHLNTAQTESYWLEVAELVKQVGKYKDAIAQMKREAFRLHPDNGRLRASVVEFDE